MMLIIFTANLYSVHGGVLIAFNDEICSEKKSMYFHVLSGLTVQLGAT